MNSTLQNPYCYKKEDLGEPTLGISDSQNAPQNLGSEESQKHRICNYYIYVCLLIIIICFLHLTTDSAEAMVVSLPRTILDMM